jgi:hypothetical protein
MKSKFKITCPAMKLRGLKSPKTTLIVYCDPKQIGVPWRELRPLIACAFRHIQREGFRDYTFEFLRRMSGWTPELTLSKGYTWYGRAAGYTARVFVGRLHPEAQCTTYPRFKDMPVFWHKDWKEHLVGLVAHELWHRWQPGTGKKAEMMCELVESDAIDTYRREQGYTFVTPPTFQPSEPPLPPPAILPSASLPESSAAMPPSSPHQLLDVPAPSTDQCLVSCS